MKKIQKSRRRLTLCPVPSAGRTASAGRLRSSVSVSTGIPPIVWELSYHRHL